MKTKNILLLAAPIFLFVIINGLLFINKPLKSDTVYFNEAGLGIYLESISAKDLLVMLNKNGDYYTFGHYTIPNLTYKKYKKIIKIKKTEIGIIRVENIDINDAFYNSSCNILIVFSKYKPKYPYLNYKNKNITEDEVSSCFNSFPIFNNINK